MATQIVEFRAAPGLTLTARLFTPGNDSVVQTASTVTEATNRKGTYAATFTDPGAAEFELIALSGTTPVCRWFCTLTLTTATFQAYDVRTAAVVARVTANTDQWGGVAVTGMPLPTASYTTPPTVAQVVTGVYAALPADHTVSGSYGVRFILALNSNRTVQVTGSNHIAADVHEFQTDVISANAIAASAVTELQAGLATSAAVAAVQLDVTTLLGRITATLFSGITYLSRWLGALAGKTADASTQTEIRATTAGATYTITTDSLEAIRDNSGGGGGSGDASQTTLLEVQGTVNGIAASLSGTTVSVSSRVSAAGEITLWAGDDCRVRSGTQIDVTITDVGGAIYTRLDGIGIANLAWGAARIVQPAGAITGTIAALTQAGSGASQTLKISIEITDGGSDLRAADDYTWQIVSSEQHGTEYDQQVELEGSLVLRRRVAVPVY
jgi:hypothetical protein